MTETIVTISNLSLPYKTALLGGQEAHEEVLERTGADGYLWSVTGWRQRTGLQLARAGKVFCLHESWREDTVADAVKEVDPKTALSAVAFGGLARIPLLDESHSSLEEIHKAAPPDIRSQMSLIIHPMGQSLGGKVGRRHREGNLAAFEGPIVYQPTAELMTARGISVMFDRPETITAKHLEWQAEKGWRAAVDVNHLAMERGSDVLAERVAIAFVRQLGATGTVNRVQLSAQLKFGSTLEQLQTILGGDFEATPQGRLFKASFQGWPLHQPRIADIEMKASDIRRAGYPNYIKALRELVSRLRDVMQPTN